jgi:hypothetical protein
MQIIMFVWNAIAPVAVAAACALAFFYWNSRRNDDDDGPPNAPGLIVETFQRFPFGFHNPNGANA